MYGPWCQWCMHKEHFPVFLLVNGRHGKEREYYLTYTCMYSNMCTCFLDFFLIQLLNTLHKHVFNLNTKPSFHSHSFLVSEVPPLWNLLNFCWVLAWSTSSVRSWTKIPWRNTSANSEQQGEVGTTQLWNSLDTTCYHCMLLLQVPRPLRRAMCAKEISLKILY